MNPVAFINVEERKLEWATPMTWNTPTIAKMDKVPLYTLKELTDEEITELSKILLVFSHPYELFKNNKNFQQYQLDFAKAVLQKASEK